MIFPLRKNWKYQTLIWSRIDGRWQWEGRPFDQYSKDELLNEFGQQGWEVIAVTPHAAKGDVTGHEYVLKRRT